MGCLLFGAVAKWKHYCRWPDFVTAGYSAHRADLETVVIRAATQAVRSAPRWAGQTPWSRQHSPSWL